MSHYSLFLLDKAVCFCALASIHGPEIFREFLVAVFMVLCLIKKKPLGAFYHEGVASNWMHFCYSGLLYV